MTDNLLYYLGFSHFLGIGPVRFAALKKYFGSAKKAYLAEEKELVKIIGQFLAKKFIAFRNKFDPLKKMEELKKKDIQVLAVDDKDYPESLKNISDPPICLYVKSEEKFNFLSFLNFAIVGTRSPTQYGVQIAKMFSYQLAEAGLTIVSGLAYGIDTVAHKACLEANGKTVAVLGCGVDIVYPAANRYLYEKIIKSKGAVISEFSPGKFVEKGLFVARNRIISALSQGVMVIEGTKDSGSLITARYAAEQGKNVFAPPSPITSKMSAAPNILLKEGAKLVTSITDIFEEFGLKIAPKKKEDIRKKLTDIEGLIFNILEDKPLTVDDLGIKLGKPINEVLNILSLMEVNGIIEKNNENRYQIRVF